jgi:hypothetical protein
MENSWGWLVCLMNCSTILPSKKAHIATADYSLFPLVALYLDSTYRLVVMVVLAFLLA